MDSESFDHGAKLKASAIIKLQKGVTENEVSDAVEVIRFAIEEKTHANVFELIEAIFSASPDNS